MLKPQVLARAIPTTLALALLACQQPLPTAKLAVAPTTQPESLATARPDAPKRKLMAISQDVWNALAADWPELGADGVDDLVNLKAFELEQSTASLNASGSDPGVSLAVSTSAGWVYLENADPVSIHALEQDVYRQADSTPAAQGYRLQAVPYSPPFKYSYSSLISTSLYGNLWHPMPEYVGYDYAYGILSCDLALYQSFLSQFGGTTHLALCFGRGTPDPFVGCGKFFQTQQYTLPDGTKTSGFGAAAGSGNYYSQINLPGPWTIVKGAAVRGGSTSFTAYFDCSIHKTFSPKARTTEGRLLANAALTPDELANGARKANGATRVTAPSGGRVTLYRDPVTGEFRITAGPAPGTGVRPAPPPSPAPTATPSTSGSASPTLAPSFAPSEVPNSSPTPTPRSLTLAAAETTFSPNGDTTRDTCHLTIGAGEAWSLAVDGVTGLITSGAGQDSDDVEFIWNGQVNGITLPDGKYNLRLKAGTEEKTTEVIIDTTKPQISSAIISNMAAGDSDVTVSYGIDLVAIDPDLNGSNSGIKKDSGKLSKANTEFGTYSCDKFESKQDTYRLNVQFPRTNSPELNYTVSIADEAGNAATFDGSFSLKFETAGDFPSPDDKLTKAYSIQAMNPLMQMLSDQCFTAGAINPNSVFYKKSGEPLHYCLVTMAGMLPAYFPVPAQVDYIKKVGRARYARFNVTVVPNPFFGYGIDWDGGNAPEGEYIVEVTYGGPGVSNKDTKQLKGFKLSNIPCVSESEWQSYSPLNLAVRRAGHILDRHILDGSPASLFSDYDPSFQAPRPAGYTERDDFTTQQLIGVIRPNGIRVGGDPVVRPIYDNVIRIGRAVREGGKGFVPRGAKGGPNPTALVAPIVLKDSFGHKRVVFVRDAAQNGVSHWTIFPDSTSQAQYEQSIR